MLKDASSWVRGGDPSLDDDDWWISKDDDQYFGDVALLSPCKILLLDEILLHLLFYKERWLFAKQLH